MLSWSSEKKCRPSRLPLATASLELFRIDLLPLTQVLRGLGSLRELDYALGFGSRTDSQGLKERASSADSMRAPELNGKFNEEPSS
jgi:hypothetical protein